MDIWEITGFSTGVARDGVNFLEPKDAFQNIENGFIYRQVLQSRKGIGYFAPRLAGETRVLGIFEHVIPSDASKLILAFDTNFLYKYNTSTGVFDQIPFGGSMAAYTGFNITEKNGYISGISYPDKDNNERFVFCGEFITPNANGSAIFFYDGTEVLDFTNIVDNPDYANPLGGTLTVANFVTWFNNRLNFIVPTIQGIIYQQVLFSGINNSSGTGDKFNVAGSGQIGGDTYEDITGFNILGQVLSLHYRRSNYALEITKDAFNPYFIRKVPSVLGTDAKFSSVVWDGIDRTLGRTGILGTDGRTTLRIDDKIPHFTEDEIEQTQFDLTYGGFDRSNNQFLWSYVQSGSESETQNKVLVNGYDIKTWFTYDLRVTVFGQTEVGLGLTWDEIEYVAPDGNQSWDEWDTTEDIWDKIGLGASVQKTLVGDDLGFIYEWNVDYDDYLSEISTITNATNAVLTISGSGFQAGDKVTVSGVEGMTEINNFDPEDNENIYEPWIVISATPTSITLNVDSTLWGTYTSGGHISKVISFKSELIPFNPYRSEGRKCYISEIEFYLDTNGGNLKVDIYDDEDTENTLPYKKDIPIIPSSNTTKAREWVSMIVDHEANFHTIILKQESPAVQVKLTSMRIHCQRGALTSG